MNKELSSQNFAKKKSTVKVGLGWGACKKSRKITRSLAGILRCEERHDGSWPHRYVLRAAEQAVHEAAHECRIQTILQKSITSLNKVS